MSPMRSPESQISPSPRLICMSPASSCRSSVFRSAKESIAPSPLKSGRHIGGRVSILQLRSPLLVLCSVLAFTFSVSERSYAQSQDEVKFSVIDVQRPTTRWGRQLTAPRYIYLQASRDPLPAEARRLSSSEKRALRTRGRRSRRKVNTRSLERKNLTPRLRPWEGQQLSVYRLSPAEAREYPTAAHLEYFEQLRAYERRRIEVRDAQLKALASAGSPIALTPPKASPEDLERLDDDDELGGTEDGEICGLRDQACCKTTQRGPCDTGLMCIKDTCQPPPEPCGGFEQMCCIEGPSCRVSARQMSSPFSCLSSDLGGQRCLIPPPKPERLKTPIGVVKIVSIKGRVVKALVQSDVLKNRHRAHSLNAISIGDKALWHSR